MLYRILLIIFLIFSCHTENKEVKLKTEEKESNKMQDEKQKIITLKEFNEKYSYWNRMDSNDPNMKYIKSKDEILDKYIKYKEKKQEQISNENIIFENLDNKEKGKQLLKLLVELEKEEKRYMLDWTFINESLYAFFESQLYNYNESLPDSVTFQEESGIYKKEFLKLLENEFTKDEIEIILKRLTLDREHGGYDISGKYELKKVDEVIKELKKVEGITSEEWEAQEGTPYVPLFNNEVNKMRGLVYLLSDNKIIIINEDKTIKKEIKIKDHKKVDVAIYKGILYIYDDGKMYEYSLKNLDDVKVIDIKELKL